MKMHKLIFTLTGLLLIMATQAQESRFFMPKEIREAYQKNTRSKDGKPGPDYWQNTVDYTLEVDVEPETRKISGKGSATYINQSPDVLNTLVVRLYYDVFRKANPRDSRVNPEDIDDGVELIKLSINGVPLDMEGRDVQRAGTNVYITLSEPLNSGEKLTLSAEWVQFIPLTNRRTGVADKTSFFVAYWYPQISVYDDVFGWDTEDYTLRTEFYNNLANFDVKINAPKSYTVWATGVHQNPKEVFPASVYERYDKALSASETVQVIGEEDLNGSYANQSGSWHFKAEEVTDFAFALSDHYMWSAANQVVDGRNVLISSVYPMKDAKNYVNLTTAQQKIMKHFSEDFPAVPYPYPRFTSFIGLRGGGMEFPMMAYNQDQGLEVTAHEMFHTYFPMYVRTNERRFSWMDEGWADFATSFVLERYFSENKAPLFANFKGSIQGMMGTYADLPLITSSQFMDGSNFGYSAYSLPSFIYAILNQHLGDALFLKAYQEYIRRWAKKSPTPYDFFYTFEDVSGQDLSWLWKPWFFEQGYADIVLKSFQKGMLTVQNTGNRPVPLQIDMMYTDGSEDKLYVSAATWNKGPEQRIKLPRAKEIKRIGVNATVADFNELDNFYPPLKEQLKAIKVSPQIYGNYLIQRFNITMSLKEKDGLPYMQIPAVGMASYLIPNEEGQYITLDKMVVIDFQKDGESIKGLNAQLKQFNVNIEGKKQ